MAEKTRKSRLEQLKQLEEDIKKNPTLLHDLVVQPAKAVAKLDYLDDRLKTNLGKSSLLEVLSSMTGVLDDIGAQACGSDNTCGSASCGSGTCTDTCKVANSCSETCRGTTCAGTKTIAMEANVELILESLILYSEQLRGINEAVFRSFTRR